MTHAVPPQAGTVPGETAPRSPWLKGIVPPVCTPFNDSGEVDTGSLERHVSFLLEAGVHGLFLLGSSSEVAFLTDAQRDTVVEVAVKANGGQVPVLAGAIDMSTSRALDHAMRAKDLGAEAIVITLPFYARTLHPAEIELHFRTIAERTGLPVVGYDIPVAVHAKLETSVALQLANEGLLQGIKDSSNDIHAFRALLEGTRRLPGFSVFTGSELIVDCALFLGAEGAVPGLANVDPHAYVQLYNAAQAGDWDHARRLQDRLFRLFRLTECADPAKKGPGSSGLGGFKTALMLRGIFATNAMGLPQIALDDREIEAVRTVLTREGLL